MERRVMICTQNGVIAPGVDHAQFIASRMFDSIGVRLEWRGDPRDCAASLNQTIVVSYSNMTPASLLPGAPAYALPYEGVHIEVFCDRMHTANGDLPPNLLAHVLVHEITHILEGISRHSASGVMKARWTNADLAEMLRTSLSLTEEDVVLIHQSLDARTVQGALDVRAAAQNSPAEAAVHF
jgi:hypothetical protein